MSADSLQPSAPTDTTAPAPTSKYARLSATDIRVALEMSDGGYTQTEIARVIGCSQSTISETLKAFSADAKSIAKQLRALTDESIEDWREARKIAAQRGDHRPARELLEAAHPDLRPLSAQHHGTGGVTVIVAVPNSHDNPLPVVTVRHTEPTEPLVITPHTTPHTMATSPPAIAGGGGAHTLSPAKPSDLERKSSISLDNPPMSHKADSVNQG